MPEENRPDEKQLQAAAELVAELHSFDELTMLILNGHFLLERIITDSIETFLLHSEKLDDARLSFAQKLRLASAMSLTSQNSPMWKFIGKINTVRNKVAHGSSERDVKAALNRLRDNFENEFKKAPTCENEAAADRMLWLLSIAGAKGFLQRHVEEVARLKGILVDIDKALNLGTLANKKQP